MAKNVIEFAIQAKDEFSSNMGAMSASLDDIGKRFAIVTGAVAAATAAFVAAVKPTLDMADSHAKAAAKIGTTTEEFGRLAFAAKFSNVSNEQLVASLGFLNKTMGEAKAGAQQQAAALRALGVTAKNPHDAFLQVVDALNKIEDQQLKTAIGTKVLGDGMRNLAPLFRGGSQAIREMGDEAVRTGNTFTDDLGAAAEITNDNIAAMWATITGGLNQAVKPLIPAMAEATSRWYEFSKSSQAVEVGILVARSALSGLFNLLKAFGDIALTVGEGVATTFKVVGSVIGGAVAAIAALIEGDFEGAARILDVAFEDVTDTINKSATALEEVWKEQKDAAVETGGAVVQSTAKIGEGWSMVTEKTTKAKDAQLEFSASVYDTVESFDALADKWKEQEQHQNALAKAEDDFRMQKEAAHTEAMSAADERIAKLNEIQAMQIAYNLSEEEAERLRIERVKEASDAYFAMGVMLEEQLLAMGNVQFQVAEMMTNTVMNMTNSISQAIASAIVTGESLSQAFKNIMKSVATEIIAQLIRIGIQRLILAALGATAARTQAAAEMSKSLASVYLNSFASAAAIPFIGAFIAPGVAAANLGTAAGGAAAAMSLGTAMGGAAHGGLDFVPEETTYLLQRGERVLSPRQNQDLNEFMSEGGNGGGAVTIGTVEIHVLENATNAEVFARMDAVQLREALGQPVVDALDQMFKVGVVPQFARNLGA